MHPARLLVVYDPGDGFFNLVSDWTHRLLSPDNSPTRTVRGADGSLSPWRTFLACQPCPTVFYLREDFQRAHPAQAPLPAPAILGEFADGIEVLLSAEEIAETNGLLGLIGALQERLATGPLRPAPLPGK